MKKSVLRLAIQGYFYNYSDFIKNTINFSELDPALLEESGLVTDMIVQQDFYKKNLINFSHDLVVDCDKQLYHKITSVVEDFINKSKRELIAFELITYKHHDNPEVRIWFEWGTILFDIDEYILG